MLNEAGRSSYSRLRAQKDSSPCYCYATVLCASANLRWSKTGCYFLKSELYCRDINQTSSSILKECKSFGRTWSRAPPRSRVPVLLLRPKHTAARPAEKPSRSPKHIHRASESLKRASAYSLFICFFSFLRHSDGNSRLVSTQAQHALKKIQLLRTHSRQQSGTYRPEVPEQIRQEAPSTPCSLSATAGSDEPIEEALDVVFVRFKFRAGMRPAFSLSRT